MGLTLKIFKIAGDQRNERDICFHFDEGMTILQLRKIIEKIQYRLVDSKYYVFRIIADETISDSPDAKLLDKVVTE